MTTSFKWIVSALDLDKTKPDFPDLVITVHWRLVVTDSDTDTSEEVYGADSLAEPQELSAFIDFSALTEQQVVSWLEQKLQGEMIDDKNRLDLIKETVLSRLEQKLQPKVVSSQPPWLS